MEAVQNGVKVVTLLIALGFIVHAVKSDLTPKQEDGEFLGAVCDFRPEVMAFRIMPPGGIMHGCLLICAHSTEIRRACAAMRLGWLSARARARAADCNTGVWRYDAEAC